MSTRSPILSFVCIFLGTVIFLLSIGSLLIKGLIACGGLALINIGLKLQHSMPLQYHVYRWFNRSPFRGW